MYIEQAGWQVIVQPASAVTLFMMNRRKYAPEIIEAVKYLVSSAEYVSRNRSRVKGVVTNRIVQLPEMDWYLSEHSKVSNRFNLPPEERVAKAKQLLAKVSVTPQNPITMNVVVIVKSSAGGNIRTIFPILEPYGIIVDVVSPETPELVAEALKSKQNDALFTEWRVALPDPSGFLFFTTLYDLDFFLPNFKLKFDELIKQASQQQGDERLELLRQAEELMINEGSVIPLIQPEAQILARQSVCGITPSQSGLFPTVWLSWRPEI